LKPKRLFSALRKLSFTQLLLVLHIWWLFLKWDLLVSFFHYKYWRLTFAQKPLKQQPFKQQPSEQAKPDNKHSESLPHILGIIRLSERVGRHHLRHMNCLRRCLCQQQLLATKHYICQLHIGVKITENKVQAHSWLSYQGALINDSEETVSQYTELEKSANSNILTALRGKAGTRESRY
jgi:hypothetical protein